MKVTLESVLRSQIEDLKLGNRNLRSEIKCLKMNHRELIEQYENEIIDLQEQVAKLHNVEIHQESQCCYNCIECDSDGWCEKTGSDTSADFVCPLFQARP